MVNTFTVSILEKVITEKVKEVREEGEENSPYVTSWSKTGDKTNYSESTERRETDKGEVGTSKKSLDRRRTE